MPALQRIKLLDNRVANQIAAGEVVERPASVVKELMENSIDAGATRIDVEIERGGTRLIRVTDNGKGIHKQDLGLALTRHATSKISESKDLATILSLGFRGEALASISSVSHTTLTSRPEKADIAWQACTHGREMLVDIQPAAAAIGTRIEVSDLFYNTPARQKFLRTEKTEFVHIEETFKRQVLAHFELAFTLKHNHKVVKRAPACGDAKARLKRIATICGKGFADHAIALKCQHELIDISGWVGHPSYHRSESDIQYVFINQRPVKDKTLNHAIRQAYEGLLPAGRMPTYVIYLTIDPAKIDVNVHPTKHEVRFDDQRLVHDLLAKSVKDCLLDCSAPLLNVASSETEQTDTFAIKTNGEIEHVENRVTTAGFSLTQSEPLTGKTRFGGLTDQVGASSSQTFATNRESQAQHHELLSPRSESPSSQQTQPSPILGSNNLYSTANKIDSKQVLEAARDPQAAIENGGACPNVQALTESYWLVDILAEKYLVNVDCWVGFYLLDIFNQQTALTCLPLLFPQTIVVESECLEEFALFECLNLLGFSLLPTEHESLQVKAVPKWIGQHQTCEILEKLTLLLVQLSHRMPAENYTNKAIKERLANLIAEVFKSSLVSLMQEFVNQSQMTPALVDKAKHTGCLVKLNNQNLPRLFNREK
ncbi:DNA mismatch repair endonuclease MutL [Aliikangiella sp. IMCC44653]